ncbi:MAG TPA: DUF2334 domain-containing protein [Gaiellaceae bacterium]|nr:DUF2334 domain-containing protein [Gaiellaceae bacterium]
MPRGQVHQQRTRSNWSRSNLLALALAALIAIVSAAGGAATVSAAPGGEKPDKPAKPDKPPKDHPSKKGLVSALGGRITVTETATQATGAASTSGVGIPGSVGARTLVLYDTTGSWGWMGELYGMATANLVSHFGSWTAKPVADYVAGELGTYTATVYIGSTYDEPLPEAFLDDVYNATRPVIWVYDNIWALTSRYPEFETKYGWMWEQFDLSPVSKVVYDGVELTRDAENNGAGIMRYWSLDDTRVEVVATAVREDGTTLPWGVRSETLTYVGEIPYVYVSETDRLIAFEDMLFDALDPGATERHRALVRLEDISPATDAESLREVVDYLYGQGIPFGFGVTPYYRDPLKFENPKPTSIHLSGSEIASLVTYMQARGGVSIMHGYTHQYEAVPNPYNGVTGDDYEFYRVTEAPDHSLVLQGPVPLDSASWAAGRIDASAQEFRTAGLPVPQIFEFPHYAGSAPDYAAVASRIGVRWERALYFGGSLEGGTIDYGHLIGQLYPYVVRDVHGSVVLPENVGNYEPEPFYTFPAHSVADILAASSRNLAVRDGFAAVYYHSDNGVEPLSQVVSGLRGQGWTFVDPAQVAGISEGHAPVNTALPGISGKAEIGQRLTATPGTWVADPPVSTFGYQWLRCDPTGNGCSNIRLAQSPTYTVQRTDGGRTLRVKVTATNSVGSASATSAPTPVVPKRK